MTRKGAPVALALAPGRAVESPGLPTPWLRTGQDLY